MWWQHHAWASRWKEVGRHRRLLRARDLATSELRESRHRRLEFCWTWVSRPLPTPLRSVAVQISWAALLMFCRVD